ncbi:MAG: phage shock protein PspA [Pseudomonadota bacterium]
MGIFSRFADIINANLNALLDKAEDPQKMIRLIIQEMEDTLVEVRTNSARTIADKKELERKIIWHEKETQEWQNKAELALSKDREDLAKAALLEKKRIGEVVTALQREKESIDEVLLKLSEEIEQLETKLKDAKSRQQSFILRAKTADSRLKLKEQLHNQSAEGAFQRFDQFERKLDDMEAKVESYDLGRKKTLSEEIAELEVQDQIDQELAALKAKVAPQKSDTKETKDDL